MFYSDFSDPQKKQRFLEALQVAASMFSQTFANDNMLIFDHNIHFLKDPKFVKLLEELASDEQEKSLSWRLHTLISMAQHALHVEGDFIECGVFRGFCSQMIAKYLEFETVDKQFYLYDTYEGFPEGYNEANHADAFAQLAPNAYEEVKEKFAPYPNVKVVKGAVPASFSEACPDKIAFLHIDMNSAKAEVEALEQLFDKVSVGGIIILDDFGWFRYRDQMEAELVFMQARHHHIMELPTGQGLLIKH